MSQDQNDQQYDSDTQFERPQDGKSFSFYKSLRIYFLLLGFQDWGEENYQPFEVWIDFK